jgi:hypothetical protein
MNTAATAPNARIALPPNSMRRLLTKIEAADYCGVCVATFDQICPVCPVALAAGRARLLRYDVTDLDAWIDQRKHPLQASSAENGDYWLGKLDSDDRARQRH